MMTARGDKRSLLGRIVRQHLSWRYRADEYYRWFPKSAAVMRRYFERFAPLRAAVGNGRRRDKGTVAVVVAPWFSTAVPWYSLMLGVGLARRGRKVVILWDDTGFPQRSVDAQNGAIADVLALVQHAMPVRRVSTAVQAPPQPTDARLVQTLTEQNVTWTLRGAAPSAHDQQLVASIRKALARSLPLVRSAVAGADPACLVVPGGVPATSGLFLAVARERSRRAATFDVDRGIAQICVDGIAAQGGDLPRAFETVWSSCADARTKAITAAREEFSRRSQGRDRYGFQVVPSQSKTSDEEIAAVIPLNVEWDSAALGRHTHFANTVEWLSETIRAVFEAEAGSVIVRQHPSERRPNQRSRLDIGTVLRDRFGDDGRLRFVAADEETNTYDLVASARLVLPFVSTIGVEAAALGKAVLVSGASYYADLGFVWSARSRDEYFMLLRRGLRGELPLLAEQCDRAWVCYYVAAVSNRVWTNFTPAMDDFWKWCRRAPESLFSEPEVNDILEAIDTDVPLSLVRRRHIDISTKC